MGKTWSEEKLLKKLGIDDFGEMTEDMVPSLISMSDKINSETFRSIMEQCPDFANFSKEMAAEYKDTLDKALTQNDESMKNYYAAGTKIIDSLQKMLEDDNLTFEEKQIIIDKMTVLHNNMFLKDSENKRFLYSVAAVASVGLIAVATVAAAIFGGDSDLPKIGKQ